MRVQGYKANAILLPFIVGAVFCALFFNSAGADEKTDYYVMIPEYYDAGDHIGVRYTKIPVWVEIPEIFETTLEESHDGTKWWALKKYKTNHSRYGDSLFVYYKIHTANDPTDDDSTIMIVHFFAAPTGYPADFMGPLPSNGVYSGD